MAAPQAPLMADPQPSWHPPAASVSDPSALTTQQLLRVVSSLDAVFTERLEGVRVRLDAMDKAYTLFHEDLVRVPTQTDRAVAQLKELHEKMFTEKFATIEEKLISLQIRLEERDERVKQAALDTKIGVDAALAAQEKSVSKQNEANAMATAKSEEQFTRQIEQLRLLQDTTTRAMSEKIDDVKDLVLRGEGRHTGISASLGTIFAIIGAIGVIVGLALAFVKN